MDPLNNQNPTPLNNQNPVPQPVDPPKSFLERLKSLPKKKLIIIAIIFFIAILSIAVFLLLRSSNTNNPNNPSTTNNSKRKLPENVAAKVGETNIPQNYLDLELKSVPATPTAELKKQITEKLIDDEITLQFGSTQSFVNYHELSYQTPTLADYQNRTNAVQLVKDKIDEQADYYQGELVAINFYNNGKIGASGLEKNKEISSQKINQVYTQVKNKQITLQQAGQILSSDSTLADVSSSYKEDAFVQFRVLKNRNITFWGDFNKILQNLNPGEISPLYLGQQKTKNGQVVDAIFMFGTINAKNTNSGYSTYTEWLNQQKGNYEITRP